LVNTRRGQIVPRGECKFTDGSKSELQDIGMPQPGMPTMTVQRVDGVLVERATDLKIGAANMIDRHFIVGLVTVLLMIALMFTAHAHDIRSRTRTTGISRSRNQTRRNRCVAAKQTPTTADEIHFRNGKTYAVITDDRDDKPLRRPHMRTDGSLKCPTTNKVGPGQSNPDTAYCSCRRNRTTTYIVTFNPGACENEVWPLSEIVASPAMPPCFVHELRNFYRRMPSEGAYHAAKAVAQHTKAVQAPNLVIIETLAGPSRRFISASR